MSRIPTAAAENGHRPKTLRTALVIDADIHNHLTTRRALRETGVFQLILSATDEKTARDLIKAPETPEPMLILLSEDLAENVMKHVPQRLKSRAVLLQASESSRPSEANMRLRKPVTVSAIRDILNRLG